MFSIKETLKYGWQKSKENMELVFFATLLTLAVGMFTEVIDVGGQSQGVRFSLLGFLALIFSLIIRIGYNKIFLRICDGEKPKFAEIFKEYRMFWRYLGVSILTPLAVLGGLVLLVVPGIIWAVRFSFAVIILIDLDTRPIKAMKESYAITKGHFWKLLGFWVVLALFNVLGLIAMGIGLLITLPVSTFAMIYVYRLLSKAQAGISSEPLPSPQIAG